MPTHNVNFIYDNPPVFKSIQETVSNEFEVSKERQFYLFDLEMLNNNTHGQENINVSS